MAGRADAAADLDAFTFPGDDRSPGIHELQRVPAGMKAGGPHNGFPR